MASKQENRWQAESDARSVAEAAAVKADPARLAAARVAAKSMAADEKKRAAGAVISSNALSKLAGTTKPKPKAKPKPKPKAKPKPKPKAKKKPAPKSKAKPRR